MNNNRSSIAGFALIGIILLAFSWYNSKQYEKRQRQEALVREIREELDADIEVGRLIRTVEWDYPEFHLTLHCFLCTLSSEALHLNEHEAARWLRHDDLRSVEWLPADIQLLPELETLLEK